MAEDHLAVVVLDVLVEPQAGPGLGQDGCESGLADLKRIAAQVIAVQLDQVEGIEEDARVIASYRMRSKLGTPSSLQATASPSMMQDRDRKAGERLDDQREALGQVIARTAGEPHL